MLLTSLLISIPASLFGGYEGGVRAALWSTGAAGVIMIPIAARLVREDESRRNPLIRVKGRMNRWEILWMVLLGPALAYMFNFLLVILHIPELFPAYNEKAGQILYSNPILVALIAGGVIAPIAEELVSRGVVYQRIRDYLGVRWGIFLSALIFGIVHGNMMQFIYAFFLGLVFAWFMEYFHTILAPILLHASANIWSFLLTYYGKNWAGIAGGLPMGAVIMSQFLVIIFSIIYLAREERK